MKKTLFILFLIVSCQLSIVNTASAQVRIGYLDYNEVMRQMPEYAQAQQSISDLKTKYDQEATRGEEEFQRKFAEFLQGQKDFPQNILVKRQAELQALMENGLHFRHEAKQLLSQAEADLLKEVTGKLNEAVTAVGLTGGYACILNTSDNQCPFINPAVSDDVTELVLQKLGVKESAATPVQEESGE